MSRTVSTVSDVAVLAGTAPSADVIVQGRKKYAAWVAPTSLSTTSGTRFEEAA